MNNKKIIYILTIIIALFSFNIEVNAATELTCVYQKGFNNKKVMFKQDSAGNKYVYLNPDNVTPNDSGWEKKDGLSIKFKAKDSSKPNTYYDSSNNFTTCPPYSELSIATNTISFYDYNKWLSEKLEGTTGPNGGDTLSIIATEASELTCENLFSGDEGKALLELIKWAFMIVKIAVPVLLVAFGIMDFAKAIFAGKEDEMKKSQDKFIKRVIIGVCFFLVPTLLKLVLTIANGIWGSISPDFCGII